MTRRSLALTAVVILALLLYGSLTAAWANPCAASPPAKALSGTVKSVAANSVLIVTADGTEWTFALSPAVVDTVQKLRPGEPVTIRYTEMNGGRTAVQVARPSSTTSQ